MPKRKPGRPVPVGDPILPAPDGSPDPTETFGAVHVGEGTNEALEYVINGIPGSACVVDRDLSFLVVNDAFLSNIGRSSRQDVVGKRWREVRKDGLSSRSQRAVRKAFDTGQPHDWVTSPEEERNTGLAAKGYAVPLQDQAANIWGVLEVLIDISDLRRAERSLRENEERFRRLAEASFEGIGITRRGHVIDVNQQILDIYGYTREEMIEGGFKKLVHPDDLEMVLENIRDNVSEPYVHRGIRKDGSVIYLEVRAREITYDGEPCRQTVIRDVTDRKRKEELEQRLEQQIQRSERLESLGVLAGGIAHDFNNLLSGIYGSIEAALAVCNDDQLSEYFSSCLDTLDRARGLTRQLLTFAKGGAPVMEITPVDPFLRQCVRFALSGANVSCHFDIPLAIRPCEFDPNQMGQVVDNLVINAVQAMPRGGTITVSARDLTLGDGEVHGLEAGDYVRISIADQGKGISEENLPKIFDPFFTTKHGGTGLGLSTSYSIVRRHRGAVEVESRPGKGATFYLYLPAASRLPAASKKARHRPRVKAGSRILIMDDEATIRKTLKIFCQSNGYDVVTAERGQDAVRVFEREAAAGRPFDAVVLDLTVRKGMGGKETCAKIRALDAEVPVFVMSGYANDPILANPGQYGFTAGLAKPFRESDLLELLTRR